MGDDSNVPYAPHGREPAAGNIIIQNLCLEQP